MSADQWADLADPTPDRRPSGPSNTPMIALLVLGAIAFLGGGVLVVSRGGDVADPTAPSSAIPALIALAGLLLAVYAVRSIRRR